MYLGVIMLSIDDELLMVKRERNAVKAELDNMDPTLPENRFKYANKESELRILDTKIDRLEEQKANQLGIPYKKLKERK